MRGSLLSYEQRQARQREKQRAALLFLSQTIYSTADILGRVMGLQSAAPVYRTLKTMQRDELIVHSDFDLHGVKFGLFGITPHGQTMAHVEGGAPRNDRYFAHSRVASTMLIHYLDCQRLHLQALRDGWTEWCYDIENGKFEPGQYRPDAIARDRAGNRWAIEYERTTKTPKRYPEILAGHLRAIRAGKADRVVWICPSVRQLAHLRETILSIRQVPLVGGRTATIEPRHHARLAFATADEFPTSLTFLPPEVNV
ncbi:MAG TPA: hypothetical protein VHD85_01660 [Terracidiphilus sp.]|jgi:hypothetical protein|nr:hypothetical protein [Terracidiphilus sp.]